MLIAGLGIIILLIGAIAQVIQLVVSIRQRDALARRDRRSLGRPLARMGDRIAAARLQFRGAAECGGRGALLADQAAGHRDASNWRRSRPYEPIEVPRNSPTGFITAFFATITGFALIWHIWWLVAVWGGGRLCGLRLVRLAGRRGIRNSGGRGRADRSRPPCRAPAMA